MIVSVGVEIACVALGRLTVTVFVGDVYGTGSIGVGVVASHPTLNKKSRSAVMIRKTFIRRSF
jgi:hypothetical protein